MLFAAVKHSHSQEIFYRIY